MHHYRRWCFGVKFDQMHKLVLHLQIFSLLSVLVFLSFVRVLVAPYFTIGGIIAGLACCDGIRFDAADKGQDFDDAVKKIKSE